MVNFKELTNWLLEKCCDNPDIISTKSNVCDERSISCRNCLEIVIASGYDKFLGRSVGEKWNNIMVGRARKKREPVEVDVNEYPFVYAIK